MSGPNSIPRDTRLTVYERVGNRWVVVRTYGAGYLADALARAGRIPNPQPAVPVPIRWHLHGRPMLAIPSNQTPNDYEPGTWDGTCAKCGATIYTDAPGPNPCPYCNQEGGNDA